MKSQSYCKEISFRSEAIWVGSINLKWCSFIKLIFHNYVHNIFSIYHITGIYQAIANRGGWYSSYIVKPRYYVEAITVLHNFCTAILSRFT